MKKRIIICILIACILCAGVFALYSNRTIGKLSGPENELVVLNDGTSYTICDDDHTYKDKGLILGKITGSYNISYIVFSVRGDSSEEYIYVAAMGRGEFYKRIN